MEHSHASKKEHLTLLDTKKRKQHQKRTQMVLRGAVPRKQQKQTIILYAVTTVITPAATTMMITVKLTKWKKQHHQPFHLPCYATISSKKNQASSHSQRIAGCFPIATRRSDDCFDFFQNAEKWIFKICLGTPQHQQKYIQLRYNDPRNKASWSWKLTYTPTCAQRTYACKSWKSICYT